jgi:hypothetical protein
MPLCRPFATVPSAPNIISQKIPFSLKETFPAELLRNHDDVLDPCSIDWRLHPIQARVPAGRVASIVTKG